MRKDVKASVAKMQADIESGNTNLDPQASYVHNGSSKICSGQLKLEPGQRLSRCQKYKSLA